MIHIAQQKVVFYPMNNNAYISIHSNGPEMLVPGSIKLMKTQPRIGRVHLQVKRRRFGGFLLVTRQFGKAVGESISDTELH